MSEQKSMTAVGFTAFAGVMMVIVGVFQAIAGLGAILEDKVYVVGQKYVFTFDVTTWGWIHLLIGLLLRGRGRWRVLRLRRGAHGWCRDRRSQCDRELRVPLRLEPAVLVHADHRPGRRDHLGPDHARSGRRPGLADANRRWRDHPARR